MMRLLIAFVVVVISIFTGKSSGETPLYTSLWKIDTLIVPSDFDPQKSVLLFLHIPAKKDQNESHKKATGKMNKMLQENYPYPYEIVSPQDLNDPKYSDTIKYRYVIYPSVNMRHRSEKRTYVKTVNNREYRRTETTAGVDIYSWDFFFYDRVKEISYPATGKSASWFEIPFSSFLKTLKKVRGF